MANQREHLILLLANVHMRQWPKPDQSKVFVLITLYCLIFYLFLSSLLFAASID